MLSLPKLRLRARRFAGHTLAWLLVIATLPTGAAPSVRAQDAAQDPGALPDVPVIAPGSAYRQRNLISDLPGVALVQDPLLVNPWGLSLTATSPFWVANSGTSTTQLIRGDVGGSPVVLNANPQTVTIPGGLPTGTVANPVASEFVLPGTCASAPCGANFLFASITGNITGWDPNAPAAGSTTAVIAASHPGHVYTGLAIANNGSGNFLYAADFANGRIDVFNSSFALQPIASFPFADPTIPSTPGNTYHPFNVQAVGNNLYVTYAKVGPDGLDVEGVGNGYVRRFNANGVRDLTFAINNGALNSPWGVTVAPATFGIFGGALLVGNFGRGNPSIHAYNPTTGAFLGTLQDESGQGIRIDELWDLKFGNGTASDANTLYFAAGIANEEHGLFGALNPTTSTATSLVQFSSTDAAISEGAGHIDITVTRAGDASGTATVNYATFDESGAGHASQKSDYEFASGTLSFAPGETSKTFRVLIVDDRFVEGSEVIDLVISNPTGAGLGLGSPNVTKLTINDNDAAPPTTNPIDETNFFVRQHYLDFLNREPDPAGLAFWVNNIDSCGSDIPCRVRKRIDTSAAFFLSQEFQQTGFLVYRTHKAAFGSIPNSPVPVLYGQFMRDTQAVGRGFVVGQPGADAQLEANRQAYFDEFVTRPEFVARYGGTTNTQYVDALLANGGVSTTTAVLFITRMTGAQEVPANASGATGVSILRRGLTSNNISVSASFTPLSSPQTDAHIHGPAAPGVNAPVIVPLPRGQFTNFGATLTNQQLADLGNGLLYINIHSQNFPGGEIRGQYGSSRFTRDVLINALNDGLITRAQALRLVADAEELRTAEFNRAFVAMQYFGYLRRDPDTGGFNFWLQKLNDHGGDFRAADMVQSFLSATEYRQRFGPN